MILSRRAIAVVTVAMIAARSLVFVVWPQSYLDANQAVIGLMAKHIAEGRAWPVFMYGQSYVLATEAWLAAPLFLAFGVSVAALKLPLLLVNVAVGLLLLYVLTEEVGLSPQLSAVASLFVVLPSPSTAAQLLEANGGSIETFFYVLLLWLLRKRPAWCGLVLGLGLLQRTFTVYGYLSLLLVLAARRELFTRLGLRRTAVTVLMATALWAAAEIVKPAASAMGPGTTLAELHERSQAGEIAGHLCIDLRTILPGFERLVSLHWPLLFGTRPQKLVEYGIESRVSEGLPGAGVWLSVLLVIAAFRIALSVSRDGSWRPPFDACDYLALVGALSAGGYVMARCGVLTIYKMNYDLLSLLCGVGIAAWYLRIEPSRRLRTLWVTGLLAWTAIHGVAHARLWTEYATHAPQGGKFEVIEALDRRGLRYGYADYALAYPLTFLTNERIVVASSTRVRVLRYQQIVEAHRTEAVHIERQPCGAEPSVTADLSHLYICSANEVAAQR
jgi:hypothetical protein